MVASLTGPVNLARDAGLKLHNEADALDVISSGLAGCIFTPAELHPQFFELSNRIAGNILQKLVNYRFPTAIVLPEDHGYGDRVTELVRDHRAHPCVRFFTSIGDAQSWFSK